MRKISACLMFLIILTATLAYAHGSREHSPRVEFTEEQASERALKVVAELVKVEKLAASWAQVKPSEVKKRTYKGTQEWMIIFDNSKEVDSTKRKLYLSLSIYGDYNGANHTVQ